MLYNVKYMQHYSTGKGVRITSIMGMNKHWHLNQQTPKEIQTVRTLMITERSQCVTEILSKQKVLEIILRAYFFLYDVNQ